MYQNFCFAFAPSMSADSYSVPSMPFRPETKYSMLTPVHLHIHSNSSATQPVPLDFSQGIGARPSHCMIWFIWPPAPSENIRRNSIPEITTEVSAGIYMMIFQTPRALVMRLSIRTASSIGIGTSSRSVSTMFSTLLSTAVLKNGSLASFA